VVDRKSIFACRVEVLNSAEAVMADGDCGWLSWCQMQRARSDSEECGGQAPMFYARYE